MTFVHPQATIIFRHGPRPAGGVRSYDCTVAATSAGIRVVNGYRGKYTVWTITWRNMPMADRLDLESFFIHTRGVADTWTWTWSDGTVKTVRFKNSMVDFEESGGVFSVTLELME